MRKYSIEGQELKMMNLDGQKCIVIPIHSIENDEKNIVTLNGNSIYMGKYKDVPEAINQIKSIFWLK